MHKKNDNLIARKGLEISIIIPVRNEEKLIGILLDKLSEVIDKKSEIIVVDDHSVDESSGIVRRYRSKIANLKLVSNNEGIGFADALRKGFKEASGKIIIPVMADCSDEITLIPVLCRRIQEGYDVVCASRYIHGGKKTGGALFKHILSWTFCFLMNHLGKVPVCDVSNSFKAYRRKVLEEIKLESRGFDISTEIVIKAFLRGYKITEIPTIWHGRDKGKSKFSFLKEAKGYIKWLSLMICHSMKKALKSDIRFSENTKNSSQSCKYTFPDL